MLTLRDMLVTIRGGPAPELWPGPTKTTTTEG
jgi:hypothetical protein